MTDRRNQRIWLWVLGVGALVIGVVLLRGDDTPKPPMYG
jgi:hypothetical protein